MAEGTLIEEFKNKRFRMIPIIDEELHLEVKIAHLKDQPLSPAASAFLKLLVEDTKKNGFSRHAST